MLYMRVLSFLLAGLSFVLLVNIVFSFTIPSYRTWIRTLRDGTGTIVTTTYRDDESELDDTEGFSTTDSRPLPRNGGGIARIEHVPIILHDTDGTGANSVISNTVTLASSGVAIPLPQGFLNKTNGKFTIERIPNTGIFGITDIDSTGYSTYRDVGKNMKIFAFKSDSSILTDRVDEIGHLYTLRKNTSYFDSTLFFNRKENDHIIRFIVWVDGKDVAIEVPLSSYDTVRSILLGK